MFLWDALNKEHNPRFAQQYSALVAGYALIKNMDPLKALAEFNFDEIKPDIHDQDEVSCIDHLTNSDHRSTAVRC